MHAYCPKVTLHAEVEHALGSAACLSTEQTQLEELKEMVDGCNF